MPIAGVPRNPFGEVPGSNERSRRNHPNLVAARDQDTAGRHTVAEPGTIRRFIRAAVGYTGAAQPFSWTRNAFSDESGEVQGPVTSTKRFLISTRDFLTAGNQRSNPIERAPIVRQPQAPPIPIVYAGNLQHRPTVRNRMTSFGSRVAPINAPSGDGQ